MNLSGWKSQPKITSAYSPTDIVLKNKVLNAEVTVTNFLVQYKLPLATVDHLGPMFKSIFPDCKIAQSYGCARQKTSAIINEAFQPYCHNYLVEFCKNNLYSVGHDGSNDTGVGKMNPVCIKIFDIKRSKTVSRYFFDMFLTEGDDAAKASTVFAAIEERFTAEYIPWNNCVNLNMGNTNALIGIRNSVASRFLKKNNGCWVSMSSGTHCSRPCK